VDGVAVVVGVDIDVVLLAAVLRQLMNLLSEPFAEIPAAPPIEEADVPPKGMVLVVPPVDVPLLLVLFFVFFAANAEGERLPAVTSAIAMIMTMLASASDLLFVYIRLDMQRGLL
jgi:hypothetical protein